MKRNYILLSVLIISLFIIAGCTGPGMFDRFYGQAIHTYTPPSSPELSDFPKQFLVDDDVNYILSFEDAIVADSSYDLSSFYNILESDMCSIVNDADYDCQDMQENVISTPTGSFFANLLSGASITGASVVETDVRPIYRCWWDQHWSGGPHVHNHFLSFDHTCGGGVNQIDGLFGYLYKNDGPGRVAITQCVRTTEYEGHIYSDHFVVSGTTCPEGNVNALLGYASETETADTFKAYRCWNIAHPDYDNIAEGRFDHMLSSHIGCEIYNNENVFFNFIKSDAVVQGDINEKVNLYVCKRPRTCECSNAVDYYVNPGLPCPAGENYKILGQIYKYKQPGANMAKLVYCYWPDNDDHLLAINECGSGTQWRADLGYVYTTQETGTIELHRCKRSTDKCKSSPTAEVIIYDEHYPRSGRACPSTDVSESTWYILPFCTETDNGAEYNVKGTTTSVIDSSPKTDYCDSEGKLHEFSCDHYSLPNGVKEETITCDAGYSCSDGACVASAVPEKQKVYRCWYTQGTGWKQGSWPAETECPVTMNHYLSLDACEGNNYDVEVGELYTQPGPGRTEIKQYYRQKRYCGHNYVDHFLVKGDYTPAEGEYFNAILGYAPETESTETIKYYRCHNRPDSISHRRYDHMISTDIDCEMYNNEYIEFYFLKSTPGKSKQGEVCSVTSDCETGLECFNGICVSSPWPNGHSCTDNTDCSSGYCDVTNNVCADSLTPKRNHIYRCWWQQHWSGGPHVNNHYVSLDSSCEGNHADGIIGDLYAEE